MTLLAQSITTDDDDDVVFYLFLQKQKIVIRPPSSKSDLVVWVCSRSTSWSFFRSSSSCLSFATFRLPLLMANVLNASSVAAVFVFPNQFEVTLRLPGPWWWQRVDTSTPVVSPNDALLLRFVPCTLNVCHCFFWQMFNRCLSMSAFSSAELTSWTCPCSDHM